MLTSGESVKTGAGSSLDQEVERGLLAVNRDNMPSTLAMNVFAAFSITAILVWAGAAWAPWWLLAVFAFTAARAFVNRSLTRADLLEGPVERVARWRRLTAAGLHMSSVTWVTLAYLTGGQSLEGRYTIAIVFSALAAGATAILAPLMWPTRIYIAAMLLSTPFFLFEHDGPGLVMCTLSLVFFVVMLIVHRRNHHLLRSAIALRIENRGLVDGLQKLNGELEAKVEERTQALTQAAYTDGLTGLPNRRSLLEWMDERLDPAASQPAAALFLDLDRFKEINDALGHAAGDEALIEAAKRMRASLPADAMLARWGGDEFVLVLPHRKDALDRARSQGHDLIAAMAEPFILEGQIVSLGLSVGMALYPTHAESVRTLLLAADLAVAEAKRAGRGRVVCYDADYAAAQKRRYDLSRALPAAIADGDLALHYQPIVDSKTGRIYGYEALARWDHQQLGTISPEEFIPIAEESDVIVVLGEWALATACADASKWTGTNRSATIAVNVSVRQLASADFCLAVARILARTGLAPTRLDLEVTESVFADDNLASARAAIQSLRALGVGLSIDDFGAGYSSLSRLLSLPVSTVKIDRTFVREMDGLGGPVIESTLLIARRLGLRVIAEGIETAAQASRLRDLGVELVQGYYYGHPAPDIWDTPRQHAAGAVG
ncbi:putative bifunctional diguanylate cyclase/phosphodiesterase [Qipengyuania sp.]|uniref:putative bifunctional diguanylate cyclase/phosphodiesterase n=1 Tax=Qipengyuania sp. TaxID=2004515 RepID=UPI0035C7C0FE